MKNITFEKLRRIKHALPAGSIASIAKDLKIDEQTVRNYFGAHNYQEGQLVEFHLEPGPQGGIVHLEDETILNRALQILGEKSVEYIILPVQTESSDMNAEITKRDDVFKKMESLRKRLKNKGLSSEVDVLALANEINA